MSPTGGEGRHGFVEAALGAALLNYAQRRKTGRVGVGEVGVYTRRNPDTVRGMDVFFISNERYAQRTSRSFLDVDPELIAEALSLEGSWSGVMQQMREYFAIGVRLVWIVDPQARRVYVYRSMTDVREFADSDELPGDDVLPGFSVPVAALFE